VVTGYRLVGLEEAAVVVVVLDMAAGYWPKKNSLVDWPEELEAVLEAALEMVVDRWRNYWPAELHCY